jgi:hypothetical protein
MAYPHLIRISEGLCAIQWPTGNSTPVTAG